MLLAAGLGGVCLVAGPPLVGVAFAAEGLLGVYPWLIALAWLAGLSLLVGIGFAVRQLFQARGAEIARLERERRLLQGQRGAVPLAGAQHLGRHHHVLAVDGAIEYHSPSAEPHLGLLAGRAAARQRPRPGPPRRPRRRAEPVRAGARPAAPEHGRRAAAAPGRRAPGATSRSSPPTCCATRASVGIVATFRDITERKEFEQALRYQAFHDALTDLPNRTLFVDRVERALARARSARDRRSP